MKPSKRALSAGVASLLLLAAPVAAQGMMQGQGMQGQGAMGMHGPSGEHEGCPQMQGGMPGHGMGQAMGGRMGGPGGMAMAGGHGQGLEPPYGDRVVPPLHLSTDDVARHFAQRLERYGNERLKLGEVKAVDEHTITVDVVTVDNSLVRRLSVDRDNGAIRPAG